MNDTSDTSRSRDSPEGGTAEPTKEIREIRETIDHTRAQMTQTLSELQERLSPAHIKAQIRDQIRHATIGKVEDMAQRANDKVYEARQSVVSTVTANPIPAAMVGIGLAWLLLNRRNNTSDYRGSYGASNRYSDDDRFAGSDWRDRYSSGGDEEWRNRSLSSSEPGGLRSTADAVSGAVGQARDAAGDVAARVKDRVSGAVDQTQQAASQLMDQARQRAGRVAEQAQQTANRVAATAQTQAYQAQQQFNRQMNDNPLAVGAIALAIGTAIGLALPQTRKENEWMGETRDNLLDNARSVVQDATEQVRQVARDATAGDSQSQFQTSTSSGGGSQPSVL